MISTDIFTVSKEDTALRLANRLDRLLSSHFPTYSRTYFQYLIEEGCILVNGKPLKKGGRLKEGDEIEVCFLLTPEISQEPEPIPLDILYEDEQLIAVNKPAGMVVHPAPGHPRGTFVHALLHHCQTIKGMDPLRPGIVHRLDKDTTGVLVAAKTPLSHARLVQMFAERKVEKKYVAICFGTPKEGVVDAPIGRDPRHRKQMAVCLEGGKPARTGVAVLKQAATLSLVSLALYTGRTHQIRVHMRHIGTPILGDPVYGSLSANKQFPTSRQMLHAHTLSFPHPIDGTPIEVQAPIPEEFSLICQKFT